MTGGRRVKTQYNRHIITLKNRQEVFDGGGDRVLECGQRGGGIKEHLTYNLHVFYDPSGPPPSQLLTGIVRKGKYWQMVNNQKLMSCCEKGDRYH